MLIAALLLFATAPSQAQYSRYLQPPELIHKVEPKYTSKARKAGLQGAVVLEAVIGIDGKPSHIKIKKGLGMGLDQQAVAALKQWRFRPAMRVGKPVLQKVEVEVEFPPFRTGRR